MEAGLAILIVLTLGLAGAAGVLSPRATEREQNETAAENDSTKASLRAGGGRKKPDGRGRNNRRRAVSDHGKQQYYSSGDGRLF